MPVSYVIEQDRALIRTRCLGEITLAEVLAHFQDLVRDPACPSRLDVLLDLGELTSLPQPGQLRTVAHGIGVIQPSVKFRACAIVAPRDVIFGLARMFEAFATERFEMTQVCRTVEEAETWLGSQPRLEA